MAGGARSEESPADPRRAAATSRPRLGIVVAGQGSVTPVEVYAALRDTYDLVFLVASAVQEDGAARSPAAARLESAMRALARRAEVCWLPGRAPVVTVSPEIRDLSGVTTFCAEGVEVTSWLTSELGLPALQADGGKCLYDKVAQRAALGPDLSPRWLALPQPCCRTGCSLEFTAPGGHIACNLREWEQAGAQCSFPAVLKPARGQASRGVRRVEDAAGLRAARHEIASGRVSPFAAGGPDTGAEPAWLLEEFLTGRDQWPRAAYVSVESVVSGSDVRHVALTRKLPMTEPFRELGQYLLPSALEDQGLADEHSALLEATSRALSRLRVQNAVTHTELTMTPDGPKVIEVNARVGGLIRDLVKAGRGVDLARAAAAVAVGQRPDFSDEAGAALDLVFQYGPLAPVRPAVFERAHGVDAVLSLAGVEKYVPHVAAGESLSGGTETQTLAVVSGACRDEDELAAVVTDLEKSLWYEFRLHPDGQPACCDARGIPLDGRTQ